MGGQKESSTLIGLVLFVACGLLVFIVVTFFIQRQIMRKAIKSKAGQHIPIGYNIARKMRLETRRRLRHTVDVKHEPTLLSDKSIKHNISSIDFDNVPYLYRMKALDTCKMLEDKLTKETGCFPRLHEHLDVYLVTNKDIIPFNEREIQKFCRLYRHARQEPQIFGREDCDQLVSIVTEMINMVQGTMIGPSTRLIRPIADIDEIQDEDLSRSHSPDLRQRLTGWVRRLLGKKTDEKRIYESVPSNESLEMIEQNQIN